MEPHGLSQLGGKPRLGEPDVEGVLRAAWGISGRVHELASERDQNWLVYLSGEPRYVVKIANSLEHPGLVDFQQQMMARGAEAGVPCPRVVPAAGDRGLIESHGHRIWMITFLSGTTLAHAPPADRSLLRELGRTLGALAQACVGFDHPAAHRAMQWDPRRSGSTMREYRHDIHQPQRRAVVDAILCTYEHRVLPQLNQLPHAVIHNDANDHNVLTQGDEICGLIDFGDAVYSPIVNEVAVAATYAMLDRECPWKVSDAIVNGFTERWPLSDPELALLPDLIRTRLATSVSIAAHQSARDPDNAYLSVSQDPAWRLLDRLVDHTKEGTPR